MQIAGLSPSPKKGEGGEGAGRVLWFVGSLASPSFFLILLRNINNKNNNFIYYYLKNRINSVLVGKVIVQVQYSIVPFLKSIVSYNNIYTTHHRSWNIFFNK